MPITNSNLISAVDVHVRRTVPAPAGDVMDAGLEGVIAARDQNVTVCQPRDACAVTGWQVGGLGGKTDIADLPMMRCKAAKQSNVGGLDQKSS